jgi:ATP-binding cassette subfamily F protein 3
MIVSVDITEKSFGDKQLYDSLRFDIQPGEKLGIVGRNGTGKSTLLHMITGEDTDFQGDIAVRRGTVVIASRQEHHGHEDKTVLEYIQGDLPEFAQLHRILTTYPATMGDNPAKIQRYSDALERFTQLGYFQVEDELGQALEAYQLPAEKLESTLAELSGGQKRMVELIKVQRAKGDLALIDEPTNHMDYVAKQAFIGWLKQAQEAVVVITHDRDVLAMVDRIIEIRNGRAYAFRGNYEHYLRVNRGQITSQVNEYDLVQRRIQNLTADVIRFRRLKEKSRDPGTIKRFKSQEEKAATELAKLSDTRKTIILDRPRKRRATRPQNDQCLPKIQGQEHQTQHTQRRNKVEPHARASSRTQPGLRRHATVFWRELHRARGRATALARPQRSRQDHAHKRHHGTSAQRRTGIDTLYRHPRHRKGALAWPVRAGNRRPVLTHGAQGRHLHFVPRKRRARKRAKGAAAPG